MELHCLQDGVGLLVLGHSEVQGGLLLVRLSHGSDVVNSPERHNRVSEEQPSQSSHCLFEDLTEIKDAGSTSSRHQVNEDERHWGALQQEVVWVLTS